MTLVNSNCWFFVIYIIRVFRFAFIQAIFLKLNRILTKIDNSCVKSSHQSAYTHPPTGINLTQTVGRIDTWVTPKTNRSSFCLIVKLSHTLDGLFNLLSRLHGHKHKCAFCWMKDHCLNMTTFRYCCLGFFLAWNSLFIFRYRCCDGHFPCFGKYIFPQLQTCSADCTEGSCSSNIPSNF